MNSLSWLIYLAGITGGIKAVFSILGALILLTTIIYTFVIGMEHNKFTKKEFAQGTLFAFGMF